MVDQGSRSRSIVKTEGFFLSAKPNSHLRGRSGNIQTETSCLDQSENDPFVSLIGPLEGDAAEEKLKRKREMVCEY